MKQVFLLKGNAVVVEVPPPSCGENDVLVQNHYSVISAGTEKLSLESSGKGVIGLLKSQPELIDQGIAYLKRMGLSNTLKLAKEISEKNLERTGYSCCGKIIKTGSRINDLAVGDIVACGGAEIANHAEINAIPRNLCCRVPANITSKEAAFATIGSIALQGVRRSKAQIGDVVVVLGLGLVGTLTIQLLKAAGCRVLGVDIDEKKLQFAEKFGLKKGFSANSTLIDSINNYCDGIGADKTIICASTKSNEPLEQAIGFTRKKGIIIAVGTIGMNIPRKDFYKKELDFGMSCSYGPGRYDTRYEEKGIDYPIAYVRWTENRNMQEFLRLVAEKEVDVNSLIEKEYTIDEAFEAYQRLNEATEKPTLVFKYDTENIDTKTKFFIGSGKKIESEGINVGLIGAGSISRSYHLPNINKISDLSLIAIATKNGDNAKKIGEQYKVEYFTTDYNDIINDEKVDLVMISTRHNLHAEIVQKCIACGKNIFVEKPLCITKDELELIEKKLRDSDVNICVGFNRRFSPIIMDVKKYIKDLNLLEKGMIINFRVNSAGMTADSWMNDPEEGGGALIGEGCHFFDLMNYFAESTPQVIQVSSISTSDSSIITDNNLVANIKYRNGVLGSVLYSTIGNKAYPKERFEFFGKDTIIMADNYRHLTIAATKNSSKKYMGMNKGHYELLDAYTEFLKGGYSRKIELPVNETAIESMKLTFSVIEELKRSSINE